MENGQSRRSYQFIIRLWPEDLGGGELEWRGKVQNIATGEFAYFRDWPGLAAVVQKIVEQPGAEPERTGADVEQGVPGDARASE